MDHAVGSVPAQAPASQERPGWWQTIGCLLLAWLLTIAAVLVLALVTSPLKLDLSLAAGLSWPWTARDPWALAAALWPAALMALLYGQALAVAVRATTDWKVRLTPVVLVVFAIAALVPDAAAESGDGRDPAAAWALLTLVVVARYAAFTRTREPWRPTRLQLAALAAVALVTTAAALAYRPFHPLHAQIGPEGVGRGIQWGFGGDDERDPRAVSFGIENVGFGDARIVAVRAAGFDRTVVQFDTRAESFTPSTAYVSLPRDGLPLAPGGTATGRVRLAPGSCAGGNSVSIVLDALVVELETLGTRRTQRFEPAAPVLLSCAR